MKERFKKSVYFTLSTVFLAFILSLAMGFNPTEFARLALILAMNLFGIPLLVFSKQFSFPIWTVYVIVLGWLGDLYTMYKWDKE